MQQNTKEQNTNRTKCKCNKIQMQQNTNRTKCKNSKIQTRQNTNCQNTNATTNKCVRYYICVRHICACASIL